AQQPGLHQKAVGSARRPGGIPWPFHAGDRLEECCRQPAAHRSDNPGAAHRRRRSAPCCYRCAPCGLYRFAPRRLYNEGIDHTYFLGRNVMARMVHCVKLKREAEGLDAPPYPGELGIRIWQNVSKQAWSQWVETQTRLVNENRLNLADIRARKYLAQQ